MKRLFLVLLGVALFVAVLFYVDVSEVVRSLSELSLFRAGLLLVLTVAALCVKAWKWQRVLLFHDRAVTFWDGFLMLFGSTFLFFIAPNVAGDLYRGGVASRLYDVGVAEGTAAAVFDKILTLIAMLSVMSVASLFFVLALPLDLLVQLGVGFVVLVAAVLAVFSEALIGFFVDVVRSAENWLGVSLLSGHVADFFRHLQAYKEHGVRLSFVFVLSVVAELLLGLRFFEFAEAAGSPVSLGGAMLIYASTTIIGVMTMIPLGLGAKDLGVTVLFEALGFERSGGATVAVLDRAVMAAFLPVFGACFLWLNWKASVTLEQIKNMKERE